LDKYLLICALTIATVGAVKDVRGQRIPNWLTYSGLLAALVVRAGLGGWTELKGGLAGMLFAGGIFFLLFFIGGMGGGDVKLMAAVGAWVGLAQVGTLLIMSAIAGGLLVATGASLWFVDRKRERSTGALALSWTGSSAQLGWSARW